jgi:hypothetical protein
MFDSIKNIALNDLCLYDVQKNEWETVASLGQYPVGRYSHSMCALEYELTVPSSKLLIFGGMNLASLCHASVVVYDTAPASVDAFRKKYKERLKDVEQTARKIKHKDDLKSTGSS